MTIRTLVQIETYNNRIIELMQVGNEYRIDSRNVAPNLGIEHKHFLETLRTYQDKLTHFGLLPFETAKTTEDEQGRGRPSTYAMLNRNQVLFAITLSRNTEQVVEWKMALIDALDQLEKQLQPANAPKQARLPLTSRELDERILAIVQCHNKGVSASYIYNHHLKNRVSLQDVVTRLSILAAGEILKETRTAHSTLFTLAREIGASTF